jgi:hypothetical protein
MKTEEKIKIANELQEEISKMKKFIELAEKSQITDEKYAKDNELKGKNIFSWLGINSLICTGTQSPKYEATIGGNENIKALINGGLPELKKMLKEKEDVLTSMFK